jgi:hypothetical protein
VSADISRIDQWIYGILGGDLALSTAVSNRVYGDMAPQGASMPLVLFSYLGGADKVLTLRTRFTNAIYLIRAVASGSSYNTVETIADRMDLLLTTAIPDLGVVVRDIRVSSCTREQPHQRKDMENGVPTVYLGGFYRIRYQPLVIV